MMTDLLVGENPLEIGRLWEKMYRATSVWGRSAIAMRAISAVDVALWDLKGKVANLPVHQLLGGFRNSVPAYYSGGYYPVNLSTDTELLSYLEEELGARREQGFKAFKIKVGGASLDLDLQRVALARRVIGAESQLMVDANNAWDADGAIRIGRQLTPYDIAWLEEPVAMDDLCACARVKAALPMPIAIGENHFTRWQFRDIIAYKAADILQGDPTLMGGFSEWQYLVGLATTSGLTLAPHWTHDVNVQMGAAFAHVRIHEYFDLAGDVFNFQLLLANPVMAFDGSICPPPGAGHALVLDEKAVARYRLD